ncbi:KH domain-containing protein [Patescibacteria group bacterium]
MKKLIEYILGKILGKGEFNLKEAVEGEHTSYTITTKPENIGIVIGKGGSTIKALRNILKVKATLEKKSVSLNVEEA